MLQRVLLVESIEKLAALAVPVRLKILTMLQKEPQSAKRLSKQFKDKSAQNLNYHFNLLEEHGFIYKKYEEKNRGAFEAFYQPVADQIRIDGRLFSEKNEYYNAFLELDKFIIAYCDSMQENPDSCFSMSFNSKKDLIDFLETNTFSATARFQLNVINK